MVVVKTFCAVFHRARWSFWGKSI